MFQVSPVEVWPHSDLHGATPPLSSSNQHSNYTFLHKIEPKCCEVFNSNSYTCVFKKKLRKVKMYQEPKK